MGDFFFYAILSDFKYTIFDRLPAPSCRCDRNPVACTLSPFSFLVLFLAEKKLERTNTDVRLLESTVPDIGLVLT